MLRKIREASSGWVVGVILGPLIILFGLWGINGYFTGTADTYAARITVKQGWFGTGIGARYKDISQDEFRKQFEKERQQQRDELKEGFDAAKFDSIANKRLVMDHLVERQLLSAAAARDGIAVSAQQLYDEISAESVFQVDGKFDRDRYKEVLARQNPPMTPAQYEVDLRSDLLWQTLPNEISVSGIAAGSDVADAVRLSDQKRDLRYLALPVPADAAAPTDAELQSWYQAHMPDYRTQEQVSLEYLELDASKLVVPTTVDDETLRQRYGEQKNRFVEPEQRLASHILINVPANAAAATEKAAQAKAAALAAQARAPGADFAALARANSQDEGSRNLGGDLGWLSQGVIQQKAFATALYALKPGQISDPVRTAEGWHVIQLRDVRAGRQIPFESVRADLQRDELKDMREKMYADQSGKLVDLTLKDSTTLAPAARELGLTIQKTPLMTRAGGTGIAADPKVLAAAFSASVLEDGNTSDAIEIGKNHDHMIVLRDAQHLPVKTLPFAQEHDRVAADVQADRRAIVAKSAADALLVRATKGESLDALAIAIGGSVQASTAATRKLTVPSADLIAVGFRLPRPVQGKSPQVAIASLAAGRYALVEVDKVVDGDPTAMDPAMRESLRKGYAERLRGGQDTSIYVDALRLEFPVQIVEDRL
jgi:peptidyl-prolyl cis-trans isomerase D